MWDRKVHPEEMESDVDGACAPHAHSVSTPAALQLGKNEPGTARDLVEVNIPNAVNHEHDLEKKDIGLGVVPVPLR